MKISQLDLNELHANGKFTRLAKDLGLKTWGDLVAFVEALPYGRNSNRSDFTLVLTEKKGSCSSKHALLKSIATENGFDEVEHILGIYKMNESNTPGVGEIKLTSQISYIPEAHTYLRIAGEYFDYTNQETSYGRILTDVMKEIVIQPEDVVVKKVEIHRDFIEYWIQEMELDISLEEVWKQREACIANLSG